MICEVCEEALVSKSIHLGSHPLADDLFPIGSLPNFETFKQEIIVCGNCKTAFQMYTVPKERLFQQNYHYRASLTKDVVSGISNLVESCAKWISDSEPPIVLDIGCNDGTLLGLFKKRYGAHTIGIDPSNAINETSAAIDFRIQGYFDSKNAEIIRNKFPKIDFITFTNVFAHIEDLPLLCTNLKSLLNPGTKVIIENHYLGKVINNFQFDTFYHEHPRTYSASSFLFIASRLGLQLTQLEFPSRYGGNIRVLMSLEKPNFTMREYIDSVLSDEKAFPKLFLNLERQFLKWKEETLDTIESFAKKGKRFFGKSLPARSVMLISSVGLNENLMPALFEKPESPKVGNYVPGTKIPILSDESIPLGEDTTIVIWSWHIRDEVARYLRNLGYRGEIWTAMPKFSKYEESL